MYRDSLVGRIQLPESPPTQLDLDSIESESFCFSIAIQAHRESELYCLTEPRASNVSQSDTKQIEGFAGDNQSKLARAL